MTLINTKQVEICNRCYCMTHTMIDDDGNRYCGKCKRAKSISTEEACKIINKKWGKLLKKLSAIWVNYKKICWFYWHTG